MCNCEFIYNFGILSSWPEHWLIDLLGSWLMTYLIRALATQGMTFHYHKSYFYYFYFSGFFFQIPIDFINSTFFFFQIPIDAVLHHKRKDVEFLCVSASFGMIF